jgi:hypothetical protein
LCQLCENDDKLKRFNLDFTVHNFELARAADSTGDKSPVYITAPAEPGWTD